MNAKRRGRVFALIRLDLRVLVMGALTVLLGALAVITASAMAAKEGVEIPIVMYHSVLKDEKYHGKYVISPAELENDILYLKKHGYTAILMEDLINYTKGGELPEKPILLTFDDGYYNNYLYAFPLAKQYRVKFVISPIGRYADLYSGRDENNAYYSHATWEQLREMTGSGLVEVQNHSYDLHEQKGGALGVRQRQGESDGAYKQRISADINKAQGAFSANLGAAPSTFTYPFGAVSRSTPDIIRELGFSATLTCREQISTVSRDPRSLYGLGRFLRESGISSREFFEKRMKLSP